MKEYPVKLWNLKDLFRFQAYVYSNHLHGEIRQMNYTCNIRNGIYLAMALPLDAATLYLKSCPVANESDIVRVCNTTT